MTRTIIIAVLLFVFTAAKAQDSLGAKPVFVIVHGAWGGSWAFKKTDSLLTEKGCIVYRPSLTGLGERVHLANKEIRLQTHINDVVNMILYEDLHDIVLVGHSYGGMVISGVADSLPDRIKTIIYLDAFVPNSGESAYTIGGGRQVALERMLKDGFLVPTWVTAGAPAPKDVPHPWKTITDTISLKNRAENIHTTYILTVDPGTGVAQNDTFYTYYERARNRGWGLVEMSADHNPQWSKVDELVRVLYDYK
jgi:pimeloyl-ACP methyl ester carboxylesterase